MTDHDEITLQCLMNPTNYKHYKNKNDSLKDQQRRDLYETAKKRQPELNELFRTLLQNDTPATPLPLDVKHSFEEFLSNSIMFLDLQEVIEQQRQQHDTETIAHTDTAESEKKTFENYSFFLSNPRRRKHWNR